MKTDIQMIEMTENHLDAVLRIEESSFFNPWNRRLFLEELACRDACNFAATPAGGGRITGYLCFRLISDEMHIMRIAVNPDVRRQGTGVSMMIRGVEFAEKKGAVICYLEVNQSNNSAIRMYRNIGFQCVGKRPGYYPETKEDGLIFMKHLKEEL